MLKIDKDNEKFSLGIKQLEPNPWDDIQKKFSIGTEITGPVTSVTDFGVFVKLEENLEGLLHISELSDHKIETPEDVVKPGMKSEVRVIRVDIEERKIGLSFVHADFDENDDLPDAPPADEAGGDGEAPAAEAPAAEAPEAPVAEAAPDAE